jgi:DNA-directed RNA polymerase specialized sigma24 family protein
MSHIEITQVTEFPLGTVKSHINRAQQKLKDFVKKSMNNTAANGEKQ